MKKKNFYLAVIFVFMILINMTMTLTKDQSSLSLSFLESRADGYSVENNDPWKDPDPIPNSTTPDEWSIWSFINSLFQSF